MAAATRRVAHATSEVDPITVLANPPREQEIKKNSSRHSESSPSATCIMLSVILLVDFLFSRAMLISFPHSLLHHLPHSISGQSTRGGALPDACQPQPYDGIVLFQPRLRPDSNRIFISLGRRKAENASLSLLRAQRGALSLCPWSSWGPYSEGTRTHEDSRDT